MSNMDEAFKFKEGMRTQPKPIRSVGDAYDAVKTRLDERGPNLSELTSEITDAPAVRTLRDTYNNSATKQQTDIAGQNLARAEGPAQTLGAGIAAVGRTAVGMGTDSLRGLAGIGNVVNSAARDVITGATGSPALAAPVPTVAPAVGVRSTEPLESGFTGTAALDGMNPSAVEASNARMGLPVSDQRSAAPASVTGATGLRGGVENLTVDPAQADINLRASTAGLRPTGATNMGKYGGNADIFATKDANGRLVLTGTGSGSSGYENSEQFKQGVARAQADKAQLAKIEEEKKHQQLVDNVNNASIGGLRNARTALANYVLDRRANATQNAELEREGLRQSTLRATAVRDQANKDREFAAGRTDAAAAQSNKTLEQRRAEAATVQTNLENTFRMVDPATGKDVPDTAKIASYKKAVDVSLTEHIRALEKTGTPAAKAHAERLKKEGYAALDVEDHDFFQSLFNARERVKATAGLTGGNYNDSDNLFDFQQTGTDEGVLFDRLSLRNGSSINKNDARFTEPGNLILPNVFKTPTNKITRGLRGGD